MMKLYITLLCLFSMSANAYTVTREIAAYKAMNSLSIFIKVIDLQCNGGTHADWRIKQYDEDYKLCVNKKYKKILLSLDADAKIEDEKDLYSQNSYLSEELILMALTLVGLELSVDQYGRRFLDLKNENVTDKKIYKASYILSDLVDNEE